MCSDVHVLGNAMVIVVTRDEADKADRIGLQATNGNTINSSWTPAQLSAYNAILASIPALSG